MKLLAITSTVAFLGFANALGSGGKPHSNESNGVDLRVDRQSCEEDGSCGDPGTPQLGTETSRPVQETSAGDPNLVHGGSSEAPVS